MPEQPSTEDSPTRAPERINAAARSIRADRAEQTLTIWETTAVEPGDKRAVTAQPADYASRIRHHETPELEAATDTLPAVDGDVDNRISRGQFTAPVVMVRDLEQVSITGDPVPDPAVGPIAADDQIHPSPDVSEALSTSVPYGMGVPHSQNTTMQMDDKPGCRPG